MLPIPADCDLLKLADELRKRHSLDVPSGTDQEWEDEGDRKEDVEDEDTDDGYSV